MGGVDTSLLVLAGTAASIGVVHTLLGPDHYLPFIVLARARRWSAARTVGLTLACGVGHVAGSVALGAVGIAVGVAVGRLEALEALRGDLAAWLLLGFGIAYTAWGLRRAWKNRPHSHWHHHADGTVHDHSHGHHGAHAHVHAQGARRSTTPWVLFLVFVFGPCEPLIPILMVPAANGSWWHVAAVAGIFGAATLLTMTAVVLAGYHGLSRVAATSFERYSHALAGLALVACAIAIHLGL